jgi:phytanoyl-CoA hydroxylase
MLFSPGFVVRGFVWGMGSNEMHFFPHAPVEEWIAAQETGAWKEAWLRDGYIVVHELVSALSGMPGGHASMRGENLGWGRGCLLRQEGILLMRLDATAQLDEANVRVYRDLCERMLSGEIDCGTHRQDLGSHAPPSDAAAAAAAATGRRVENTTQIMWPSLFAAGLHDGPLHQRSKAVCKILLEAEPAAAVHNSEIVFDFDMLIDKAPHTDTPVPWHQDEGYWRKADLEFKDVRAASCWVSLDTATVENGCMWFVPGSHAEGVLQHRTVKEGAHTIEVDNLSGLAARAVPAPLRPGSCTFHSGRTLHHTRGNSTATRRRAWITNHRPAAMVEYERSVGFDHGKGGLNKAVGF